jgi:hypothetical protein
MTIAEKLYIITETNFKAAAKSHVMKYKKTLADLEKVAVKWWPKALEERVASASVLPKLLETQEQFISVLKLSGQKPEQIFEVLEAGSLSANLFLKHLVVLADYGGELIKRLGKEFMDVFPAHSGSEAAVMDYVFQGKQHVYAFKVLPISNLSNTKLAIDGKAIVQERQVDGLLKDVAMILLYGASSSSSHLASLERCDIGSLLGKATAIDAYVKQKYLHVSRITTGASANSLGQIAQVHVAHFLNHRLGSEYDVRSNGKIALKGYDSSEGMPFDVVVKRKNKIVGVEVSFQVTSNSVIERKAAQAENRRNLMGREGHYIAYVLDGAGNFSRTAALTTLCQSSDCTVAFSDAELGVLADFIRGKLDDSLR